MSVKGFKSPKYFGNTEFTPENKSKMYVFIQETFSGYDGTEQQQIIEATFSRGRLQGTTQCRDGWCGRYHRRSPTHQGKLQRMPCLSW